MKLLAYLHILTECVFSGIRMFLVKLNVGDEG